MLSLVVGRMPSTLPGTLFGYTRYAIKERVYPGIVRTEPKAAVQGLLVTELSDKEMQQLDAFEDDDYIRSLEPIAAAGGEKVDAYCYVWKDELKNELKPTPWDYDKDFMPHIDDYLVNTKKFVDNGYSWDFAEVANDLDKEH